MKRKSLLATGFLALGLIAASLFAAPPARAQDPTPTEPPPATPTSEPTAAPTSEPAGVPAFRIDNWSTDPRELRNGSEFKLTLSLTNTGSAAAANVAVTIGQGASFVGLDTGAFFGQVPAGETRTAELRAAVSSTITSGHHPIPLQITYSTVGGAPLAQAETLGVRVEGLPVQGQDVGQPAFDIVSWAVEPETLQRGQEFTLNLTFQNVGTWNGNSVIVDIGQGPNFVGLQGSDTLPTIQIGGTQTVSLRGAVVSTIVTGHYELPVTFQYHHEAQGGQRLAETETLGVFVQGLAPSTGPDTGRPQIVIADSEVEPGGGDGAINLRLTLHNVGNRLARGVVVNLGPSEIFSPAAGSSAVAVEGDIKVDEQVSVTLPLVLLQAPAGRLTQDFTVEYASYSGGSFQTTERVPIALTGEAARTPRLLVEAYEANPELITPGATVGLTLSVANVGDAAAEQVFVRLGELGPFAPVGSSNVRFLESIPAGRQVDVEYQLAVDGSAEDGLVAISVELAYEDALGVATTETVSISLRVTAVPHFSIGLFEPLPEFIAVGDTFDLPVEVINIGESRVNVSTVEVMSDELALRNASVYVGPLDGGTSGTLIAEAEARQAGTAEVTIVVNYLDNSQQPQSITETLTVEVEGSSAPEDEDGDSRPRGEGGGEEDDGELNFVQRVWRAILGFLGLGTRPIEENGA